jgi:hypothetical protein
VTGDNSSSLVIGKCGGRSTPEHDTALVRRRTQNLATTSEQPRRPLPIWPADPSKACNCPKSLLSGGKDGKVKGFLQLEVSCRGTNDVCGVKTSSVSPCEKKRSSNVRPVRGFSQLLVHVLLRLRFASQG